MLPFHFASVSLYSPSDLFLLCCLFGVGRWRHRGHKSHCYWCGYEPQPNRDNRACSFSRCFPTSEMGFGHSSFNLPSSSHPFILSALSLLEQRRTFNFICSSTLEGFFLFSDPCLEQCSSLWWAILTLWLFLLLCFKFLQKHTCLCLWQTNMYVFGFYWNPWPRFEFAGRYTAGFKMQLNEQMLRHTQKKKLLFHHQS